VRSGERLAERQLQPELFRGPLVEPADGVERGAQSVTPL
jgi:hypothetical protein